MFNSQGGTLHQYLKYIYIFKVFNQTRTRFFKGRRAYTPGHYGPLHRTDTVFIS